MYWAHVLYVYKLKRKAVEGWNRLREAGEGWGWELGGQRGAGGAAGLTREGQVI